LEEDVHRKPHGNGKYFCRKCNKFIPEDHLIRLPFDLITQKKSLCMIHRYQQKLNQYKEKIKEQGKCGDLYLEVDMEVS